MNLRVTNAKYDEIKTKFNGVELKAENNEELLITPSGMVFFKAQAGDKGVLS